MDYDTLKTEILADLRSNGAGSIHELALRPALYHQPFGRMLNALLALEMDGLVSRVDAAVGIAAGGKVRLPADGGAA